MSSGFEVNYNSKDFYESYINHESKYKFNSPITNETLLDLRDQFYIELVEKKLHSKIWKEDQLNALNDYSKKSSKTKEAIKKEIIIFKSKIEDINKQYNKVYREYQQSLHNLNLNKSELIKLIDEKDGLDMVVANITNKEEVAEYDNHINKIQKDDDEFKFKKQTGLEKITSKLNPINYIGSYFNYFSLNSSQSQQSENKKLETIENMKLKQRYKYVEERINELNNILSNEVRLIY